MVKMKMKWHPITLAGATVGACLALRATGVAKPISPQVTGTPPLRYRIVKAETYTFRDEWDKGTMRGVKIWIDSPGYWPSIGAVIPDDTDLPAHWQLTDEQGNSYVKQSIGLEVVGYEKRRTQKVHVLEFTGEYFPIPAAKVGHIRLKFPLELYRETHAKEEVRRIVQVDTIITHHK